MIVSYKKTKKITDQNAGWQFCWVKWMDLIYIMYLWCYCQYWYKWPVAGETANVFGRIWDFRQCRLDGPPA